MSNSRFKRGSGAYRCKNCGKLTRETGEGESSIDMCRVCYEAAGYENTLSDTGHPDPYSGLFDGCETVADVQRVYADECAKHGLAPI